jgi:SAM-dependent methyltransferase
MRRLTAYDLYELAVTNPGPLSRFIDAAWRQRGSRAKPVLREDFSGSGALARAWAKEYGPAIAVDRDPAALKACGEHSSVKRVCRDVLACTLKADIIAATNFAAGYFHTRPELVAYLKHARACLKKGGMFCADLYGGSDAFMRGKTRQRLRGPSGEFIEYTWEQREAFPQTGRVLNAIHFRVGDQRSLKGARSFPDAFTYDWRLWSIPELRDAMLEAGFKIVRIFDRLGEAVDSNGKLHIRELGEQEPMDDPFVVYVCAYR